MFCNVDCVSFEHEKNRIPIYWYWDAEPRLRLVGVLRRYESAYPWVWKGSDMQKSVDQSLKELSVVRN
jgi:hypothetical protein